MKQEILHDQIAAYLQGSLSSNARQELELLLASNAEAQQELGDQLVVRELAEFAIANDLRKKFRKAAMSNTESTSRELPIRRWIAIAASVTILLITGLGFYASQNYSNENLASSYAPGISLLSGQRNSTEQLRHSSYKAGEDAFAQNDYESALVAFENVPSSHVDYLDARYNLGAIAFLTSDYTKASTAFKTYVDANQQTKTAQAAEWYLLLSYLGNESSGDEISLVMKKILDNPGHDYYQKALELETKRNSLLYRLIN